MRLERVDDFAGFREIARLCLSSGVSPDAVQFAESRATQSALWKAEAPAPTCSPPSEGSAPRIPRALFEALREASAHRDPERWNLYYRLLWRTARGERGLLERTADPDVIRLNHQLAAVRRDVHKMHAFVRFKKVIEDDGQERFVAWYRPDHRVLSEAAPFFARRFASMRWSILTPEGSAHWDGRNLQFGPGTSGERFEVPADELEALWRTYYAHVFNPARLNLKAMRAEMPTRFWSGLPEATLIPELSRRAASRTAQMVTPPPMTSASAALAPKTTDLGQLRSASKKCTACPLHARATQTVFGEGSAGAPLMIVGEQPGDIEDLEDRPFTGPAGQLLDRFLAEAGIDRGATYVTNAVKHFKWEPSGKRRIHQRPDRSEILACRGWLEAELTAVRPALVLCLGATAGQALLGPGFKIGANRGHPFQTEQVSWGLATYHPSALLRATPVTRPAMEAAFREDLAQVSARLKIRISAR